MANYDISAATTSIATSKGELTYYSFDVIDKTTGQVKGSYNTTDPKDAKAYLESTKKKYGSPTINGKTGGDPFEDGTFGKQGEYEFGGFTKKGKPVEGTPIPQPGSSAYEGRDLASRMPGSRIKKVARDHGRIASARLTEKKWDKLSEAEKASMGVNGAIRFQAMMTSRITKPKKINTSADGAAPGPDGAMADSEVVVGQGADNNAFIIIGNDRVEKRHSGYGGKGHTQCDAIDIVAGLGGHEPAEVKIIKGVEAHMTQNPNFFVDAARIYISQKTDVDKNFGIGEFGPSQKDKEDTKDDKNIGKHGAKSAIAVKADNIRVIGRESLKLVTGTDRFNSQGGEVLGKSGIEIVAMNKVEDLQPIVLGDNLQLALVTIIDNIEALAKIFQAYTKYQMKFNQAVQSHTHNSPFFARPTLPSETVIAGGIRCDIEQASKTDFSILKHVTNLAGVKHNFLIDSGESFINSRLNKVN